MNKVQNRLGKGGSVGCVMLAAALWGLMGLFVRRLQVFGFSSLQIAALRIVVAALTFLLITLLRDPTVLKIRLRDSGWFFGLGLVSVLLMTVSYFTAVQLLPLATAAILLYTAPILVMVMSVLFLKEKLTWQKPVALLMAFGGCVLVTGLSKGTVSGWGLAVGLTAGLAYALYTVLGAVLLRRYHPLTVTTYAFSIAAVGALCICDLPGMYACFAAQAQPLTVTVWTLATGLVSAVVPYLLYTLGLRRVEPGKAAILSYIEPLVATLLGIFVYHEGLTLSSVGGIALIVGAVVLLNLRRPVPKL